ncbi:MAG TPA: hypothetical protein VFJ90_06185, partial [Candidatus Didemnitutus sp.]|nr:hypothetical protein [Candidatus Didemnitutus sp.]
MPAGETAAHADLKRLALQWAAENGFPIGTTEVRLPRSGYRVDAGAYRPARRDRAAATVVFECKQARADLLKDSRAAEPTRDRLAELLTRRAKLEELLGGHRPDLRRGESLFPEFDAFDFSTLRHDGYAEVIEEIATLQRRLLNGIKFEKIRQYRGADMLYLVVEDGIFSEAEIPAGWGLLVRREEKLVLARPPLWL